MSEPSPAASPPNLAPLAISLGDPAGVGPELIASIWAERSRCSVPGFAVCGGGDILAAAAIKRDLDVPLIKIAHLAEASAAFAQGLPVLSLEADRLSGPYAPGSPSEAGAALALASLAEATRLSLTGEAPAMVTAPVSKAQLAKVGFEFPGQTEFLAFACGKPSDDAVMMLSGPSLRTVPVTVHCALAEVPQILTEELIVKKARVTARALQTDFGLANPRLALCALNPHAGEDGRMGHEDRDIIAPAAETLIEEGIAASGPHPADALFTPRGRAGFDAMLGMYHDQALIPIKALDFDQGVNVTLGLPIVRTSPDHGTAFDIAGKGVADPGAMIAALRMAGECAVKRARG